jgi:hypothetical protein
VGASHGAAREYSSRAQGSRGAQGRCR